MKSLQKTYEQAVDRLSQYLDERGMRFTVERKFILEQVCSLPQPFSAAQLRALCKAQRLTRATIYNSINLLCDAHVLHTLKRGAGMSTTEYELVGRPTTRMQMVCKRCGRITEFRDATISELIKKHRYTNFDMQHYSLYVYGECKACRPKRKH